MNRTQLEARLKIIRNQLITATGQRRADLLEEKRQIEAKLRK